VYTSYGSEPLRFGVSFRQIAVFNFADFKGVTAGDWRSDILDQKSESHNGRSLQDAL